MLIFPLYLAVSLKGSLDQRLITPVPAVGFLESCLLIGAFYI